MVKEEAVEVDEDEGEDEEAVGVDTGGSRVGCRRTTDFRRLVWQGTAVMVVDQEEEEEEEVEAAAVSCQLPTNLDCLLWQESAVAAVVVMVAVVVEMEEETEEEEEEEAEEAKEEAVVEGYGQSWTGYCRAARWGSDDPLLQGREVVVVVEVVVVEQEQEQEQGGAGGHGKCEVGCHNPTRHRLPPISARAKYIE